MGLVAALSGAVVAGPKVQKFSVTLTDFKFTPSKITVQSGVPVELTLRNRAQHLLPEHG